MRHIPSPEEFLTIVGQNTINAELLRRLPELGLNQCHLTAGCLFQALWNQYTGRAADWGVNDYDVFYFDDSDLSWEAEDTVIRKAQSLLGDLGATIEIRNQARVHLWYQQRFNVHYPQLHSARDGIDRYLIACTCVGIDVASGALYAPDGLADLAAGHLRINSRFPQPVMFQAKVLSYRERWPWLTEIN